MKTIVLDLKPSNLKNNKNHYIYLQGEYIGYMCILPDSEIEGYYVSDETKVSQQVDKDTLNSYFVEDYVIAVFKLYATYYNLNLDFVEVIVKYEDKSRLVQAFRG